MLIFAPAKGYGLKITRFCCLHCIAGAANACTDLYHIPRGTDQVAMTDFAVRKSAVNYIGEQQRILIRAFRKIL